MRNTTVCSIVPACCDCSGEIEDCISIGIVTITILVCFFMFLRFDIVRHHYRKFIIFGIVPFERNEVIIDVVNDIVQLISYICSFAVMCSMLYSIK